MNKKLVFLMIFCITINALIPKFSLNIEDDSVLNKALKCQSVLFKAFTLTSLPVKIVGDFFIHNNNSLASKTETPQKNHQKNAQNTSSDYSITANNNLELTRNIFSKAWNPVYANSLSVMESNNRMNILSNSPGNKILPFLFILALFILRPRGSIDANNILKIYLFNKARLIF